MSVRGNPWNSANLLYRNSGSPTKHSASFWVYHDAFSGESYRVMLALDGAIGVQIHKPSTTNYWGIGDDTTDYDSTTTPSTSTWYHVGWTRDGARSVLYIDGSSILTATTATDTAAIWVLGEFMDSGGGGTQVYGYVEALKIWSDVALTQSEIQAEMYSRTPVRLRNLNCFSPFTYGRTYTEDLTGTSQWTLTGGNTTMETLAPSVPWRGFEPVVINPTVPPPPTLNWYAHEGVKPWSSIWRPARF